MKRRSPSTFTSRSERKVTLTLWNSSPLPVWGIRSCSRTGLRGPSAAIRKSARTVMCSPVVRSFTTAFTPVESWSKLISSLPKRMSAPCARLCSASTGSMLFWLHRHHCVGLKRASAPDGSIDLISQLWSAVSVSDRACRMP